MSQFEWKTDESLDESWLDENSPTPPPRWRWGVGVALLFGALLLFVGLRLRVTRGIEAREQTAFEWHTQVEAAVAANDVDLVTALMGGGDWAAAEAQSRVAGTRFERSEFELTVLPVPDQPTPLLTLSQDLESATLVEQVRYEVEHPAIASSQITLTFPLSLTYTAEGWRAQSPTWWNAQYELNDFFQRPLQYASMDDQTVRLIQAGTWSRLQALCTTPEEGQCIAFKLYRVANGYLYDVDPRTAFGTVSAEPASNIQWHHVPALQLFGIPTQPNTFADIAELYETYMFRTSLLSVLDQPCCASDSDTRQAVHTVASLLEPSDATLDAAWTMTLADDPPDLQTVVQSLGQAETFSAQRSEQLALRFLQLASGRPLFDIVVAVSGLQQDEFDLTPYIDQNEWEAYLFDQSQPAALPVPNSRLTASCTNHTQAALLSYGDDTAWSVRYQTGANMRVRIRAVGESSVLWVNEFEQRQTDRGQVRSGLLAPTGYVPLANNNPSTAARTSAFPLNRGELVNGMFDIALISAETDLGNVVQVDITACAQGDTCTVGPPQSPITQPNNPPHQVLRGDYTLDQLYADRPGRNVLPPMQLTLSRDGQVLHTISAPSHTFWDQAYWVTDDRFVITGFPQGEPGRKTWVGTLDGAFERIDIELFLPNLPPKVESQFYIVLDVLPLPHDPTRALVVVGGSPSEHTADGIAPGVFMFESDLLSSAELVAHIPDRIYEPFNRTVSGNFLILGEDFAAGEPEFHIYNMQTRLVTSVLQTRRDARPDVTSVAALGNWVALPRNDHILLLNPEEQTDIRLFTNEYTCQDIVWQAE